MKYNNTIRMTGSEEFVKMAGDLIISVFDNYQITDSGVRQSNNPKYKVYIRYIKIDEIIIVPIRELPREYAKIEISRYIQQAGGRKVYISELAEELRLDIELIIEIMEEKPKHENNLI